MDSFPLLGIGSKAPMEGVTETEFWAERKDGPSRGCHTRGSIP
jgi:hypothetical protein